MFVHFYWSRFVSLVLIYVLYRYLVNWLFRTEQNNLVRQLGKVILLYPFVSIWSPPLKGGSNQLFIHIVGYWPEESTMRLKGVLRGKSIISDPVLIISFFTRSGPQDMYTLPFLFFRFLMACLISASEIYRSLKNFPIFSIFHKVIHIMFSTSTSIAGISHYIPEMFQPNICWSFNCCLGLLDLLLPHVVSLQFSKFLFFFFLI